MAKKRNTGTFDPTKPPPRSSLPGTVKDELNTKAAQLIEAVLKPEHVQPPPPNCELNTITDITIKWIGSTCYFVAIYACPGPHAIAPTFETKFAKLDHVGDGKFNLSFIRHTGKWVPLYPGISVDECLEAIQSDPWFMP